MGKGCIQLFPLSIIITAGLYYIVAIIKICQKQFRITQAYIQLPQMIQQIKHDHIRMAVNCQTTPNRPREEFLYQ